ncbi:MAG: YheU family protein [Pseudomonadota bacterium]|jgi:uncharacterized protein YheU (UPF0270 family)|nr:MAG: hypothetical protein DIU62_07420 [Pseudomonadota bacterium]
MTVEIPAALLSPEALTGVLEDVVLREGTDYGEVERTFAEKVAQLRRAVDRGEARILFDPDSGTVTILPVTLR